MNCRLRHAVPCRGDNPRRGFTLLEVIVACTIFFMFAFAVLQMTSRALAGARAIQEHQPDAGLVASIISLTNKLEEGPDSGDFEDFFPNLYPGWRWATDTLEVSSNGLFRITILVSRKDGRGVALSPMEIELYRPDSPPGSASALGGIRR